VKPVIIVEAGNCDDPSYRWPLEKRAAKRTLLGQRNAKGFRVAHHAAVEGEDTQVREDAEEPQGSSEMDCIQTPHGLNGELLTVRTALDPRP
jgi:hypothetical protein